MARKGPPVGAALRGRKVCISDEADAVPSVPACAAALALPPCEPQWAADEARSPVTPAAGTVLVREGRRSLSVAEQTGGGNSWSR